MDINSPFFRIIFLLFVLSIILFSLYTLYYVTQLDNNSKYKKYITLKDSNYRQNIVKDAIKFHSKGGKQADSNDISNINIDDNKEEIKVAIIPTNIEKLDINPSAKASPSLFDEIKSNFNKDLIPRYSKAESKSVKCWDRYDYGYLDYWNSNNKIFCEDKLTNSILNCRVIINELLPAPTGPHVLCDAKNLMIDFSKTKAARCCEHRPGYFCVDPPTYTGYNIGALQSLCKKTDNFIIDKFTRDHLRDIFSSFQSVEAIKPSKIESGVTFFVTRESGEHVNLYHAMTDFINIYQTMVALQIQPSEVLIVLMDDHKPGPFDIILDSAFSLRKNHIRGSSLRSEQIKYEHAVFVPPGYSSMVYSELNKPTNCQEFSGLFSSFGKFIVKQFGYSYTSLKSQNLKIAFISRKPYNIAGVSHSYMGRQMKNEDKLAELLNAEPGVSVDLIDFSKLSFSEQIKYVAEHDVLMGMHGAGMTHLLWLPPWAGVLELWPIVDHGWFVYSHMSYWCGFAYESWENAHTDNFHKDDSGDVTFVDEGEFMAKARTLIKNVKEKKSKSNL